MRLKDAVVARLLLVTWLFGLSSVLEVGCPALAQTVPEHRDEAESTRAAMPPAEASGFPALPRVTSTPGDAAEDRADELSAAAQEASDQLARAEYLLASANVVLAFELEPFCTRRFLRIPPKDPTATVRSNIEALLTRAVKLMDDAVEAIEKSTPGADPDQDAKTGDDQEANLPRSERSVRHLLLRRRAQALRSFAESLGAYLLMDSNDNPGADRAREAASKLAPMLEEEDRGVAAAALFWQSLLRSHESDPDAVLSRLDYVSAKLPPDTNPFSFFGRLLRCRSLADHRPVPVALALLLQLEERCYDWFEEESDRDRALRTVALVRMQVLGGWYDSLDPETSPNERDWCAEQARRVLSQFFEGAKMTTLRLRPAIPILVPPPRPNGGHNPP